MGLPVPVPGGARRGAAARPSRGCGGGPALGGASRVVVRFAAQLDGNAPRSDVGRFLRGAAQVAPRTRPLTRRRSQ